MITDYFLRLAASLIGFVLGFLPAFNDLAFVAQLSGAWAVVAPVLGLCQYWVNIYLWLGAIVSVVVLRGLLVIWYAVNWFLRRIPFLGH